MGGATAGLGGELLMGKAHQRREPSGAWDESIFCLGVHINGREPCGACLKLGIPGRFTREGPW